MSKENTQQSDQNLEVTQLPSERALARAQGKLSALVKKDPTFRKVIKAAARFADLLNDEDMEENLRVIREAKKATHRFYDIASKTWTYTPDHKTRLAAVALQLAYDEGLPVQRSVAVTGSFKDAGELLATLNESPAAREALKILSNLGIKVENDGEIIELVDPSENREEPPPSL